MKRCTGACRKEPLYAKKGLPCLQAPGWCARMLLASMTPSETEKALRALFKKLRPPARAICHFPKPPQKHEVCGFSIYYKGALVREYYGKELIKEFKKTAKEKGLWET